jgi:hypothetical protein
MPRSLTPAAETDVNTGARQQVWLFLVNIDHSSFDDPIRLCNNEETVISNNDIYLPIGIQVSLPDESADEMPKVNMRIADVDKTILTKLRGVPIQNSPRPVVTIRLVMAITPDSPEAGPYRFELEQHTRDKEGLTLTLGVENILRRAFPGKDVLPQAFPNLF